ncbi:hypothetical protein F444_07239 [Phytophthora nicotianae P1976]|uniref:RxLR effector protein n=2 Tax=Phytophthora nicotianae TaxID=4792 RepID=A0A081AFC0_PHYNI|nr:hypothetical protein F444_07239 [Phytophthora nicotianae P1976]
MRLQKGLLLLFAGILFTRIHIASAESDAQFNTASVPPVPDRRLRKHNFELAKEGSDTEERGLNAEAAAKAFAIDAKKIDDVASKMEIEMVNVKYNWLKYLAHQNLKILKATQAKWRRMWRNISLNGRRAATAPPTFERKW